MKEIWSNEHFREGLKYFGVSFVLVNILMFLHYPAAYFEGTTYELLKEYISEGQLTKLVTYFFLMVASAVLFTPLLYVFKAPYVGKVILGIFAFLAGLEKYLFYIQGGNVPWNSAFNEEMLQTFISEANYGGIRDAVVTYVHDNEFLWNLVVYPIGVFVLIYAALLLFKPIKPIMAAPALGGFLFLLSTYQVEVNVPYIYKVIYVVETHVVKKFEGLFLNLQRRDIYFKDFNESKQVKNIIFVMDESIRGDLISLNNQEDVVMKTTPYLYSIRDQLINFGSNFSLGNCSQISNMLFMSGLKPQGLEFQPTIFQYMKNAGYKVIYFDSPHRRLMNGIEHYDKKFIDEYISVRDSADKKDRDIYSLEQVRKLLNEDGKKFIFVLKQGSHFPYEENIDKEVLDYNMTSHEGFFNLYMNSLNNTVDQFWEKVLDVTKDHNDTIVFWQSDHGVNIVPDLGKSAIKLTHCEVGLSYAEELYNVPAAMYSPNKEYYKGFRNLENGYSTIHMLPTILYFAGYNLKDIRETYANTYMNPDKNVSIYTYTNLGNNPLIRENVISIERLEKEGLSLGAVDPAVKNNIDPLDKRRPGTMGDWLK